MIDMVEHDICRYYGDRRPIKALASTNHRKSAQAARQLARSARGKPWPVRMQTMVICNQLRVAARCPNVEAMRHVLAGSIKLLGRV